MFMNRFWRDNRQSASNLFAFNICSPQACMRKIKGGLRYENMGEILTFLFFCSVHRSLYTRRMTSCVCQIENLMFILFAGAYSGTLIVEVLVKRTFRCSKSFGHVRGREREGREWGREREEGETLQTGLKSFVSPNNWCLDAPLALAQNNSDGQK